jgi:hypothetical protein
MTWILLPSGTMLKEEEIAGIRAWQRGHNERVYECILKNVRIAGVCGGGSTGSGRFEYASITLVQDDYDALTQILKTKTVKMRPSSEGQKEI